MILTKKNSISSAVFITFPGNCKKALTFYQSCFGGTLDLEPFVEAIPAFKEVVVSGSLRADKINIYGSDLVHDEGRKTGNFKAIFLVCKDAFERYDLIKKLSAQKNHFSKRNYESQNLIELKDAFEVRWILAVEER